MTRTTLSSVAATSGSRTSRESGGGTDAGGPDEHAQGIHPLERREEPVGRELLVDPREDLRPLHGAPKLGLAGQVQQHRADRPAEDDAGEGSERETGGRVERAQAGDRAHRPPQRDPEHLREAREQRASEKRRAEGDERRVRRPVVEDGGRDLRPEVGADREPRERERPPDEPAREPVQPREDDDAEHDPIRNGHWRRPYAARSPFPPARLHCPALGGVVQLVRTPACHAGGRGFESRRSRLCHPASHVRSGSGRLRLTTPSRSDVGACSRGSP